MNKAFFILLLVVGFSIQVGAIVTDFPHKAKENIPYQYHKLDKIDE